MSVITTVLQPIIGVTRTTTAAAGDSAWDSRDTFGDRLPDELLTEGNQRLLTEARQTIRVEQA